MTCFLAAYLHTLDPYAIKLWEGGPIRWYALSYLAGFVVGYLLIRRIAAIGHSPLRPTQVFDYVVAVAIGVMVGGRVGYVLLYEPSLLWQFTSSPPFWSLLALHRGGMASHGGLFGVILASCWYAGKHKLSLLHLVDLATFAGPIGLFFGRLANFVNGELFGRVCSESFPLAARFPQEMLHWPIEKQRDLAVRLAALLPDDLSPSQTVEWAIGRIQQGSKQVINVVEPMLTPRHPSQLYEAVLEGLVLFVSLAIVWLRPRKPGVIFATCCVIYGVMRIIGEQFREPDEHIAHLEAATLGITRGQWLSGLMVIGGVVLLVVCSRRNTGRLGGWRRGRSTG